MDQLFTEAECGDILREVLAYFTAISWDTKEYRLPHLDYSLIRRHLVCKDNTVGPELDAFMRGVRDGIRQYAAIAGVCKWTWQVAKGIAGNPFNAWRDLLVHFTTAGDFTNCDIVGLTIGADNNAWPVTGNHRQGVLRRGQTYLNCDMRSGGGIGCWYRQGSAAMGSLAAVSIEWIYDTVSIFFYAEFTVDIPEVEIRGNSREEIYENLLRWIGDNCDIINICGIIINTRTRVDITYSRVGKRASICNDRVRLPISVIPGDNELILGLPIVMPEGMPHRDEVAAVLARIVGILQTDYP